MAKRKLYSEPFREICDSTTLFYVKSVKEIEPGFVRYVVFATAHNYTAGSKKVEFGKLIGDVFHSLEGTASSTQAIPTWFTTQTHCFVQGETPAFRLTNSSLNDVILGYAEGYEMEVE
jgi:hypothetical protein